MSSSEDNVAQRVGRDLPPQEFLVKRIYLKDASFEAPGSPGTFPREGWAPDVDLQMNDSAKKIEADLYEVTVTATVTVTSEKQVAYLIEVTQCGIFQISGFSNDAVKEHLGSHCLTILFPFVRATVSDLVSRGGYPQMLLAPINFQVLYHRQLTERVD